ncbi:expressed unknown protein [Ectocarpus siliculosus]|uniref:Uncharacterized protein n=1 Tax=Ectocarpus siliculosus TaxID=2880 RepID=D8LRE5_ECTSI|nr:expressed unknown protein [Ectocarpus siliculosus]|eukprot:CBN75046.1 expressed unknown protein [Ectocarpus siliculosus]
MGGTPSLGIPTDQVNSRGYKALRKHQRSLGVLDAPMTVTNGVTGTNDRRLVDGIQSAMCVAKDIM